MSYANGAGNGFPDVRLGVYLIASHGLMTILVDWETEEEDSEILTYQWVDGRFKRYKDQLPKPIEKCPSYLHDHKDGFLVKVSLGVWKRLKFAIERPYCNCPSNYDLASIDHLYPPKCRAFEIAAAISDDLWTGKSMEEVELAGSLVEMPSTNKILVYGPKNKPTSTPNHLQELTGFRRSVSVWKV